MADAIGINKAHTGVHDFDRRYKISRILANLVKFAVDSAVDGSRKIIPGRKQANKMMQEGLIDLPLSTSLKTKKKSELKVANDFQIQRKMEDDMTNLKQRFKTSTKCVEEGSQDPKKPSNDGIKEIGLLNKNGRRVFIRSRL